MLCERYKEALMEAALGATLTEDAQGHLDECGACRAEFNQQHMLLTVINGGLVARSNVAVPAHFEQRMMARIQAESAPATTRSWFGPRWAIAGVFAAILGALFLQRHQTGEIRSVHTDEAPAVAAVRKANDLPPQQEVKAAPRARSTARSQMNSAEAQEVVVAAQENAALIAYMSALNARETQAGMSAELEHKAEMVPRRMEPVEISELTVTPLSNLGTEDSASSERGRNR